MEDIASMSYWNTPFRVKVNLYGKVFDATLDTGASLSAVRSAVVQNIPGRDVRLKPWTAPPVQLADGASCCPLGVIWLSLGFLGQSFYHRFAVVHNLSSSVILGMNFMLRSSVSIHVPSRTGVLGDEPVPLEELEGADLKIPSPDPDLSCLDFNFSALSEKVGESSLEKEQQHKLTELLKTFSGLFDGHLGRTSLVEHEIVTADAKPVHLAPYCTSPAKKELIESQIEDMLREGIIEPATGPWAAPVVIVPKRSGEPRFCVDYRALNKLTVKDSYP